jgi:site-specific DNA recombinase
MTRKKSEPVDPNASSFSDLLKTAVSYPRVSTKEQAEKDGDNPDGYSLPAQREANRKKAASLGAVVVREFVERGESAKTADRPKLQEMLAYIKENPVDYVIVHKVDRLARNRADDVEIHMAIRAAGAELVSATENIDETPSGMLLHGILSSISEFYSRNLATEVLKGLNEKARTGGTPNRAPIGYRNVGVINDQGVEIRTVVVDPERGPLIAWAFQAYATGEWTLKGLETELAVRGLTTRPTPKRPAVTVKYNKLQEVLRSRYYKGEVVYNGVTYPGRHTPLVDPVTWQLVQALLTSRVNGEKQREHPHYLKSTVFCGGCGSRLIVTHAKNRHGTIYPYFVCLGRHQKANDCQRRAVLIERVEDLVEDEYKAIQLTPALREQIETSLRGELSSSRTAADREAQELDKQKKRLLNERGKLLQAHYAGAIPLDLMKQEQDRIAEQLARIETRLEASLVNIEVVENNLRTALNYASNCHAGYLEASPSVRRLFNQAFFEKVYLEQDHVRIELAEPFKTLLGGELIADDAIHSEEAEAAQATGIDPADQLPAADGVELMDVIRNTPPSSPETNKPAPVGAGLKGTSLVRERGLEPPRPEGH